MNGVSTELSLSQWEEGERGRGEGGREGERGRGEGGREGERGRGGEGKGGERGGGGLPCRWCVPV